MSYVHSATASVIHQHHGSKRLAQKVYWKYWHLSLMTRYPAGLGSWAKHQEWVSLSASLCYPVLGDCRRRFSRKKAAARAKRMAGQGIDAFAAGRDKFKDSLPIRAPPVTDYSRCGPFQYGVSSWWMFESACTCESHSSHYAARGIFGVLIVSVMGQAVWMQYYSLSSCTPHLHM